jgi:TolA-binding protein
MRDPVRLVVESADEFERDLLRAAEGDQPSRARRARALAALGVTTTTATTTAAGAGLGAPAAATVSKTGAVLIVKWVGILIVMTAASATAVHAVHASHSRDATGQRPYAATASSEPGPAQAVQPMASVPSVLTTIPEQPASSQVPVQVLPPGGAGIRGHKPREATRQEATPSGTSLERAAVDPTPSADTTWPQAPSPVPPASAVAPAPLRSDTLAAEIVALDQARSALRNRQPARALVALDDYARRFPGGVLAPEAGVLRIEALLADGNRTEAQRFGRQFLAAHPASPLAARVRALLESVIDASPPDN